MWVRGPDLFQRPVPGGRPHRAAYLRLLSPNKGIEYVLNALPQVLAEFPDVVYIVLGATHPNELRKYGEAYRLSLEILATKNKLEKHVIFCNQFVDPENLKEFMGAADLYITPYLNAAQITSGTLSFAFGSGKAVVSTPYWHAADLLAEGRGALVPFADSRGHGRQILGLLRDDTRRNAMRKNAYRLGREMIWSNVAQTLYAQLRTSSPRRRAAVAQVTRHQNPGPETSRAAGAEADASFAHDGFDRRVSACHLQCAQFQRGLLHGRQCPCFYSCGADRGIGRRCGAGAGPGQHQRRFSASRVRSGRPDDFTTT